MWRTHAIWYEGMEMIAFPGMKRSPIIIPWGGVSRREGKKTDG